MADDMSSAMEVFFCTESEMDFIELRRVGPVGSALTRIALRSVVEEVECESEPLGDDSVAMFAAPILLDAVEARRMAVALIDMADQADGLTTSFFPNLQVAEHE